MGRGWGHIRESMSVRFPDGVGPAPFREKLNFSEGSAHRKSRSVWFCTFSKFSRDRREEEPSDEYVSSFLYGFSAEVSPRQYRVLVMIAQSQTIFQSLSQCSSSSNQQTQYIV